MAELSNGLVTLFVAGNSPEDREELQAEVEERLVQFYRLGGTEATIFCGGPMVRLALTRCIRRPNSSGGPEVPVEQLRDTQLGTGEWGVGGPAVGVLGRGRWHGR